jgi:hypothetical protein
MPLEAIKIEKIMNLILLVIENNKKILMM